MVGKCGVLINLEIFLFKSPNTIIHKSKINTHNRTVSTMEETQPESPQLLKMLFSQSSISC